MKQSLMQILSFYLLCVGIWRLGNSTISVATGNPDSKLKRDARKYNPLLDLVAVRQMLLWSLSTLKNFSQDEFYKHAVISNKKFAWGLCWMLMGILLLQSIK